jgi:hypothetical protein
MAACAGGTTAHLSIRPAARSVGAITIDKKTFCTTKKKCYGIFVQGAPDNLAPIIDKSNPNSVVRETGKQPNLVMFYQAWGPTAPSGKTNFDTTGARNACAKGLVPMLTWQSWDSSDTNSAEGVAYDQPKYSLQTIINGRYDAYIRQTALAIKRLGCPVAIRLDQEQNGYWYPWGVTNTGMTGAARPTPARYIKMWRHVWRIFHNQHVKNVIWTWSPNHQAVPPKSSPDVLRKSYPGAKYVDWIALDGYLNHPKENFKELFDPVITQLRPYAVHKPLLLGETAVGGGGMSGKEKAHELTNLLNAVATRKAFVGMIYFDQQLGSHSSSQKLFADWKFDETAQSLKAFKTGIDKHIWAAGVPGSLTKK